MDIVKLDEPLALPGLRLSLFSKDRPANPESLSLSYKIMTSPNTLKKTGVSRMAYFRRIKRKPAGMLPKDGFS